MKNAISLSLVSICFIAFFSTCKTGKVANPAMEGFNQKASDARAMIIADEVMKAMGGRQAWNETRYLVWNFFGSRKLYWDKTAGNVRIESKKDNYTALVNIHTGKGQVKKDGLVLTQPDSLSKYLTMAKNMWINDSYWLVMPFKLKDSGVTLKYIKEDTTAAGDLADVLQLTFEKVGVTPENKYWVYVDKKTRLVSQWTFYTKMDDKEPRFSTPWANYQSHGKILLSGDRGDYKLTEIATPETLSEATFTSLEAL